MSGLATRDWDVDDFLAAIAENADEEWREPEAGFIDWLSDKPAEWLQRMYALLAREPETEDELYQLEHARIIRLSDGSFSSGSKCYFPDEEGRYTTVVPCVAADILEVGSSKPRKKFARKFLEELGVGEIGERELVQTVLQKEYVEKDRPIKKIDHVAHLKRFMRLVEEDPSSRSIFDNYSIFLGSDGKWHDARTIYLDRPFLETGLREFHDIVGLPDGVSSLSELYLDWKVETSKLIRFAETLGAQRLLEIEQTSCRGNPQWDYLYNVQGWRWTEYSIDRDFWIPSLSKIAKTNSVRLSKLVWLTLATKCHSPYNQYLQAQYRINRSGGSRYAASQLIHSLTTLAWVPQGGDFVRPAAARAELLPDGFTFDPGWAWIKAIDFGKEAELQSEKAKAAAAEAAEGRNRRTVAAAELGLKPDDLDWLEKFKDVPPERKHSA